MITHRADSDWETVSHRDNRMSSFKSLRTPGSKNVLEINVFDFSLKYLMCSSFLPPFSPLAVIRCIPPYIPLDLFLTSYARRRTEASFTGSGGRLSFVQEGVGSVRSPKARGSVPPGLQNQHRPRGAASLQGLLLQGTGNMNEHIDTHQTHKYVQGNVSTIKNTEATQRSLNIIYVKWNKRTSVLCCPKNPKP